MNIDSIPDGTVPVDDPIVSIGHLLGVVCVRAPPVECEVGMAASLAPTPPSPRGPPHPNQTLEPVTLTLTWCGGRQSPRLCAQAGKGEQKRKKLAVNNRYISLIM